MNEIHLQISRSNFDVNEFKINLYSRPDLTALVSAFLRFVGVFSFRLKMKNLSDELSVYVIFLKLFYCSHIFEAHGEPRRVNEQEQRVGNIGLIVSVILSFS